MASRPQPCRRARHTRESRACGQSCGPFVPRAAAPGRPLPRTPRTSADAPAWPTVSLQPSFCEPFSRRSLQQSRGRSRIIVHRPGIHERPIHGFKIRPPAGKPSMDCSERNVVPPLPDPGCNATHRHGRRRQPQKDHFQSVPGGLPPTQAGQMHTTAESRLESEVLTRRCKTSASRNSP